MNSPEGMIIKQLAEDEKLLQRPISGMSLDDLRHLRAVLIERISQNDELNRLMRRFGNNIDPVLTVELDNMVRDVRSKIDEKQKAYVSDLLIVEGLIDSKGKE